MTEEPASFDPGPAFRDDVRRARARVAAMTPEAAKTLLIELVGRISSLVLGLDELPKFSAWLSARAQRPRIVGLKLTAVP